MTAGQTFPLVTDEMLNELCSRGQSIYETLKPQLLPEQEGKYVVIHVDTGDYEIATGITKATQAMRQRHAADGRLFSRLIGEGPEYDYLASRLDLAADPVGHRIK